MYSSARWPKNSRSTAASPLEASAPICARSAGLSASSAALWLRSMLSVWIVAERVRVIADPQEEASLGAERNGSLKSERPKQPWRNGQRQHG